MAVLSAEAIALCLHTVQDEQPTGDAATLSGNSAGNLAPLRCAEGHFNSATKTLRGGCDKRPPRYFII